MKLKDLAIWNTRVSAVYALGVWSMIGSYAYFQYSGRSEDMSVKKEVPDPKDPKDPNEIVHQTAHTKTVMVYKKDFVPYTTRIYNFINSFSSEPGSEDRGK